MEVSLPLEGNYKVFIKLYGSSYVHQILPQGSNIRVCIQVGKWNMGVEKNGFADSTGLLEPSHQNSQVGGDHRGASPVLDEGFNLACSLFIIQRTTVDATK
jgi:hypothetical protein